MQTGGRSYCLSENALAEAWPLIGSFSRWGHTSTSSLLLVWLGCQGFSSQNFSYRRWGIDYLADFCCAVCHFALHTPFHTSHHNSWQRQLCTQGGIVEDTGRSFPCWGELLLRRWKILLLTSYNCCAQRSLHQYALQNKSLSQELKFSGFDQLAKDKLKLYSVEMSLCDKLRGVLSLAIKGDTMGGSHAYSLGPAGLSALLNKHVPHITSAPPPSSSSYTNYASSRVQHSNSLKVR